MMNDAELGLDTFVEQGGDRFVSFVEEGSCKETRLQLKQNPLAAQEAIGCRGTCCYRSNDRKHVAKYSWVSSEQRPEVELLILAHRRGVTGSGQGA
jgi:hypothetical protein